MAGAKDDGPGDFGLDDDILCEEQNKLSSSSSYSAASDEFCNTKEKGPSMESSNHKQVPNNAIKPGDSFDTSKSPRKKSHKKRSPDPKK